MTFRQGRIATGNPAPGRVPVSTADGFAEWLDPGAASVADATTSSKGKVELAEDGESAAGVVVQGNDARLSNARTPTAHTHPTSEVSGLDAALAGKVASDDPRLTDARTPTAHAHAQSDVTGLATSLAGKVDTTDPRLSDARAPTAHTHAIADVTGLQAALDSKAAADHTHASQGGGVSCKSTADVANSAVSLADATGLALPIAANTDYGFEFTIPFTAAATTTGLGLALNGPAGLVELTARVEIPTSATAVVFGHVAAYETAILATASAGTTRTVAVVYGTVRNGPNAGNLQVRFRSEIAGSAVTIKRGAWGRLT